MATILAREAGKDADARRETRAAASARLKSILDKKVLLVGGPTGNSRDFVETH